MVKDCLEHESGFAIVLLREGSEVGAQATVFETGTFCQIVDWTSLPNGLLGITVEGRERVKIGETKVQLNNLRVADLTGIPETAMPLSEQVFVYMELLKKLEEHPFNEHVGHQIDYSDSNRIVWALCQLLPFSNLQKQSLLEINDSDACLETLEGMLRELEG